MRIAYLTWQPLHCHDGVVEKIAAQLRAWQERGHTAGLFGMSCRASIWSGAADLPHCLIDAGNLRQRAGRARRLAGRLFDWRPDVIFFRLGAYYPALGHIMSHVPTIVDVNTKDLVELRRMIPAWLFPYYRWGRRRLLHRARAITAVTAELADSIDEARVPVRVISNGADLTQWTALPPSRHLQPGLFFLGSAGRAWHGTDKIIQLARLRPGWRFELVGPSCEDFSGSLPDNVMAHGHLLPADYTPIMARCDVAIASLAIHRNVMQQACPLKVREYLARGLPTIIGYHDPDFDDHDPYILRLPNTPDNACRGDSLAAIDRFLTRWKGQRVGRLQIQHVDIRAKEDQRLALFQHVLQWDSEHGALAHTSSKRKRVGPTRLGVPPTPERTH